MPGLHRGATPAHFGRRQVVEADIGGPVGTAGAGLGRQLLHLPVRGHEAPLEFQRKQQVGQLALPVLAQPVVPFFQAQAAKIKQYDYFGYATAEALHLSAREEHTLAGIVQNIDYEHQANLDSFSQALIVAHLNVLLTYAERFYQRQFLTRKKVSHQLLAQLEAVLTAYLADEALPLRGLPTVQYLAEALHVSPTYLSTLLKTLTGQSTQHYIHDKLLEQAKVRLSTTRLSVSEIAYELGFEHPQSFSKLFKAKTNLSPLAFRQSVSYLPDPGAR